MADSCERCQRVAPPDLPVEWEVSLHEDGTVGMVLFPPESLEPHSYGLICPDCITDEEHEAMSEDWTATAEALSKCARCSNPAPDFPSGVPEDQGWYILGDELVCTGCMKAEDWKAAEEASLRALEVRRRMRGEQ